MRRQVGRHVGEQACQLSAPPNAERQKPVVLIFLGHYLPGYRAGGPIRSIANLVEALGDEYEFRVVTSDRDLGDGQPYPHVPLGQWMAVGKAHVIYLRVRWDWVWRCRALLREVKPDLVYVNSFFSRAFSMAAIMAWRTLPRTHRPGLVLAPRGEFSKGAIGLKWMRKQTYLLLAKLFGCHSSIVWHASTAFEGNDIDREVGIQKKMAMAGPIPGVSGALIATALDLPAPRDGRPVPFRAKPKGVLRIAFLSRIVPMKNLAFALEILKGLRGQVKFTVYGPAEDAAYWALCRKQIAEMPDNVTVEHVGAIAHEDVFDTLRSNDILLFPTLGENFGHVIVEALQAGCPVAISDRTPWRNLAAAGVGWDLPLDDIGAFQAVVQQCIEMENGEFHAFRKRATEYGARVTFDPLILEQNRNMLNEGIASGVEMRGARRRRARGPAGSESESG